MALAWNSQQNHWALLTLVTSCTWRHVETVQVSWGLDSRGPRDCVLPLREKQAGAGLAGVDDETSYGRETDEVVSVVGPTAVAPSRDFRVCSILPLLYRCVLRLLFCLAQT